MFMRKTIFAAIFLLGFSGAALAQIQLGPGQVFANPTGSTRPGKGVTTLPSALTIPSPTITGSGTYAGSSATVSGNVASATFNNIIVPTPASTAVFSVGSGKTISINNSLAFSGTDGSSVAFGAGGTVLYTSSSIPTTSLTGTLQAAQEPAHTGDVTNSAGSLALSIANNAVTLAKLATQATNTVLANATSGTAVPTALAIGSCSTSASALIWTTNTGFGCNTSIAASTVATNANLTGDVTSVGNATTLTNAPVIAKVLTGYTSGAGTVSAADSILSAFQKINGNDALKLPLAGGTLTGALLFSTDNTIDIGASGATRPRTGYFGTSVISPLHYGGSSAGSTLTLNGTLSGSPSSAYVLLQSGTTQFVGINNASPKTTLDINNNTSSSPALIVSTSVARMQSADAANGGMEWVSYGGANGNFLTGAVAGGTSAVPLATPASRNMFNLSGWGYTGSAWAKGAIIAMGSASLWSGSNQATEIDFYTTPSGSTSLALAASILPSGALTVGTLTDPGIGSLQVNATIVAPNIASDAGLTDNTLCWKNSATTGTFLKGSGTLGICLGTSGAQFKTAFAPMVGGIKEVMGLNLQNYRYRNGYGDSGERMQYGLTAQDVDRVMPDLVRRDASGEVINYDAGALLFIGLRAIQQLKADNDNLESRLTKLENRK